jgi:ATP-dependent DNA helicase RecG
VDREELLERLRGVEWDDFEVKRAARAVPADAYKTVSAFANTSGGWLVFGVEEKGRAFIVHGVEDADTLQNDFLGTCRSTEKFSRTVDVKPKLYTVDGAVVLAFYVAPASRFDKPVRVRTSRSWQTFVRLGAGDHQCSSEEEARFLRDASLETFDATPVSGSSFDEVDVASLSWFRGLLAQRNPEQAHPELSDQQYLEEVGLLCADGRINHAGALFFGRDRLLARIKPGGVVDFRLVRGPWSEQMPEHRWDDRELCERNLVVTLRAMVERLARLSPQPFEMEAGTARRQADSPDYRVLREALVNLLAHQDYSDQHRTAVILSYDDRVRFWNPGDSFVDITTMLDGGSSQLRNPLLVRLLRQAGFAEQAGAGIPTIVRTWRRADRVPPELVNHPGTKHFCLVLHWRKLELPRDSRWHSAIGATVSPDGARVLSHLNQVGTVDRAEVRLVTGLPGREATQLLAELAAQRLVQPADDHEEPTYRMAAHLRELWPILMAEPVSEPVEPVSEPVSDDQAQTPQELVLALLRGNPGLRVPAIVRATAFSRATVKRAVAALRQAGTVEFRGAPKTGGYWPVGTRDESAEPAKPPKGR